MRQDKEVLEGLADGYFSQCQEKDQHPSLPGLALALGLDSCRELERLASAAGRKASALRRAMLRVEEAHIQSAYQKDTAASAKFILQNGFGYAEKTPPQPSEDIKVVLEGGSGEAGP